MNGGEVLYCLLNFLGWCQKALESVRFGVKTLLLGSWLQIHKRLVDVSESLFPHRQTGLLITVILSGIFVKIK